MSFISMVKDTTYFLINYYVLINLWHIKMPDVPNISNSRKNSVIVVIRFKIAILTFNKPKKYYRFEFNDV